ncbi:MAG: ABC transporter permease [Planctomycetes bacterium]|nr:ABC transporter permease [Planctomycetota bacterium]
MNKTRFILKSLRYYYKIHIPHFLGVLLCATILTGALLVGYSVKESLREITQTRLGHITHILNSGDHFFESKLANKLKAKLHIPTSSSLLLNGVVASQGGRKRAHYVQINGVRDDFWKLSPKRTVPADWQKDSVAINEALANYLGLKCDDEVIIRIEKPSALPKDTPLSSDSEVTFGINVKITHILSQGEFARFSLKSDQTIPFNVFLNHDFLAREIEKPEQANLLLISQDKLEQQDEKKSFSLQLLNALEQSISLADRGLEIKGDSNGQLSLQSPNVFLPEVIEQLSHDHFQKSEQIFTYFVNQITSGDKSCPYSFISSLSSLSQLGDNEIIINEWLAHDLTAEVGDEITLNYYTLGDYRELNISKQSFTVKKIISNNDPVLSRELTPHYPGLSDSENCSDWDPGLPVNTDLIRDKDEKYWDDYHSLPKGIISLNQAQKLWRNRFGALSSLKFSSTAWTPKTIEHIIIKHTKASDFNLSFNVLKSQAIEESQGGVDFSGLFIGLSFFIIASALCLIALLFVFSRQFRSKESRLLLSIGFPKKWLLTSALYEGLFISVLASMGGSCLGILYCEFIIYALTHTSWQGAVGTANLQSYYSPQTLILGISISTMVSFGTIYFITKKLNAKKVAQKIILSPLKMTEQKPTLLPTILCLGIVYVIVFSGMAQYGQENSALFFGVGALHLVGLLLLTWILLRKYSTPLKENHLSFSSLGLKSCARRPLHSLAIIASLAIGVFLVISVASHQKKHSRHSLDRASGTGGFAYYAESAIPIFHNLNSKEGRYAFSLGENFHDDSFVQLSVKDGDDASCLNLNRVSQPRLLGLKSESLAHLDAFTFSQVHDKASELSSPWLALDSDLGERIIPAIGDAAVIQWGLGKKIGDELTYKDAKGQEFHIKLIASLESSLFQGSLLISQTQLRKLYPSIGGARVVLIDHLKNGNAPDKNILQDRFEDRGFNLIASSDRLERFMEIENTYLKIFLALGGIGVIIGSLGLGIMILICTYERRSQLSLLKALGFNHGHIFQLIAKEHIILLATGTFVGLSSALISSLPLLVTQPGDFPFFSCAIFILLLILVGGCAIFISSYLALKGNILRNIREE